MPLDRQQIKTLVALVADTRENEITCGESKTFRNASASTNASSPSMIG